MYEAWRSLLFDGRKNPRTCRAGGQEATGQSFRTSNRWSIAKSGTFAANSRGEDGRAGPPKKRRPNSTFGRFEKSKKGPQKFRLRGRGGGPGSKTRRLLKKKKRVWKKSIFKDQDSPSLGGYRHKGDGRNDT